MRPDFQAMLPLYDLIVVPEHDAELLLPEGVQDRVVRVGPVLSRERCEMLPRGEARARLGVRPEQHCVYISAGGGGDRSAESHLQEVIGALQVDTSLSLVVGAGSLYRGKPVPGATALSANAAEYMHAFDAAVCAAGYNTFGELMFAGVPTVFLPQEKRADDQAARAQRACEVGAARVLAEGDSVLGAVHSLLAAPSARDVARTVVPENCARIAAAEILHLVHGEAEMDRLMSAFDGERLCTVRSTGVAAALDLAGRLRRRGASYDEALDGAISLLSGGAASAREIRGIVDAVFRLRPDDSVPLCVERAMTCACALITFVGGEGAAARAIASEGFAGSAAELASAIRERVPA
jgi:hypothetical protein